jgi:RecA-family ATPase
VSANAGTINEKRTAPSGEAVQIIRINKVSYYDNKDGAVKFDGENYIDEQLAQPPAGVGDRHREMRDLSLQMVGEGDPDDVIFNTLRARYPEKDKTDKEIWDLIKGARARNPKPAAGGRRTTRGTSNRAEVELTVKPYEHDGSVAEVAPLAEEPKDTIGDKILAYWERLGFKEDDIIGIAFQTSPTDKTPTDMSWCTLEQWRTSIYACESDFQKGTGAYFGINALQKDEEGELRREIKNIKSFNRMLVEFDDRPKPEQLAILQKSGLPIQSIVDSGGNSLHALVALGAADKDEFEKRAGIVNKYLGLVGNDKGTHDAPRYSRLPYVMRGETKQSLISFETGARSWQDFEATVYDDGLPEIQSPTLFLAKRMPLDDYLIEGLLRENSKMSMTSQSKGRKTWMQIHQALCIGSGTSWFDHETKKSPVLFVNLELKENTMNNRVYDVCNAMGIDPVTGHLVDFWNLRGSAADIAIMVQRILRAVKRRKYKLVFLDPAYKCLGWRDENKAGDITDFQNHLEQIASEADCSIVTTGHTTKGDQTNRAANDLQSGSGVWARDPDVVASFLNCTDENILKEHGEDCITVQFSGMREDKTPLPFAAKWEYPMFGRIGGVVPKKAQNKKKGRPSNAQPWDLAKFFKEDEQLNHATLKERAAKEDIKGGSFSRRLNAGVDSGCLEHDPATGAYWVNHPKVEEVKRLNENTITITF